MANAITRSGLLQ